MTTRYVDGTSGNDSNTGLSIAQAKKTLTGVEATVAAGDLVHVRAGVYRETLTATASGTAGNIIEYRGDYTGAIFGTGGVVRITGSNDDQSATRQYCINNSSVNYRTYTNFLFDTTTTDTVRNFSCTGITLKNCYIISNSGAGAGVYGSSLSFTADGCIFQSSLNGYGIYISQNPTLDNSGHVIQNCVMLQASFGVLIDRVGGIIIRNSYFRCNSGVTVNVALTVGQSETINNNIFDHCDRSNGLIT